MKNLLKVMFLLLAFAGAARAQAPSAFPYSYPVPNDTSTGTVQFAAVKINASGNAQVLATTDVNGYAGICVSNCGTSGTAWIAFAGLVPVTVDGTATAQHYLVYSVTTNGRGHDSGAITFPLLTGLIGRVQIGATVGNQAMVMLFPSEFNTTGLFTPTANFCLDAGSTDSYACNLSPAITAYTTGVHYRFKANTINTGAATLNLNAIGAITIKKAAGGITTDLADNDIRAGQWVEVVYDGTNFQMQSTLGNSYSTPSSTDTFTGKTIDAEATGNIITIPVKVWLPGAGCNNATAGSFWDLPASTPAVAACVTGTNTQKGVLQYADTTGGFSAQTTLILPADFSGAIDARIIWRTSAITGNAKFSLSTICTDVAATATDDPAFNTASTVTTAAPGTTLRIQSSAITGVTATGCSAGNLLHLKLFRDGNDAADTITASLDVVGVELTIRRAM